MATREGAKSKLKSLTDGTCSQAMEPDNTEEVPRPQEGIVVDLTNDSAVEDNDVIDLTTPKRIRVRSADLVRSESCQQNRVTNLETGGGGSSRNQRARTPDVKILDLDDDVQLVGSSVKSKTRRRSQRLLPGSPASPKNPKAMIVCPICFDSVTKIEATSRHLVTTTCGHIFCDHCISLHLQTQRNCPSCRTYLSKRRVHPLYLS